MLLAQSCAFEGIAGSAPPAALEYVGGNYVANFVDQTPTVSLTALTGGVASAAAAGDLVIAAAIVKDDTDRNLAMVTADFTELVDIYSNATNDAQLGVFHKRLTSAETSVEFDTGSGFNNFVVMVSVWRNTDPTNPIDVSAVTATGSAGPPNAGAITPSRDKTVILAIGGIAGSSSATLSALTAPSGMTGPYLAGNVGNNAAGAIASYFQAIASSYNPAAFGGGSTDAANAWCAATIALRPR